VSLRIQDRIVDIFDILIERGGAADIPKERGKKSSQLETAHKPVLRENLWQKIKKNQLGDKGSEPKNITCQFIFVIQQRGDAEYQDKYAKKNGLGIRSPVVPQKIKAEERENPSSDGYGLI